MERRRERKREREDQTFLKNPRILFNIFFGSVLHSLIRLILKKKKISVFVELKSMLQFKPISLFDSQ